MTQETFIKLVDHAAMLCGCESYEVLSDRRHPQVVKARQFVGLVCHQFHRLSYPEIAAMFGKQSHSAFVMRNQRLIAEIEELKRMEVAHAPTP